MKKNKNLILVFVCLCVITSLNIAHNSSRASIGHLFGMNVEQTNVLIKERYGEKLKQYGVVEISYFQPIWFWEYIIHKEMKVVTKKDTYYFSGEFMGKGDPIYINLVRNDDEVSFNRLGGYQQKDSKKEQNETAIKLIERAIQQLSLRRKTRPKN